MELWASISSNATARRTLPFIGQLPRSNMGTKPVALQPTLNGTSTASWNSARSVSCSVRPISQIPAFESASCALVLIYLLDLKQLLGHDSQRDGTIIGSSSFSTPCEPEQCLVPILQSWEEMLSAFRCSGIISVFICLRIRRKKPHQVLAIILFVLREVSYIFCYVWKSTDKQA